MASNLLKNVTDLDTLFMARSSAKIADVGIRNGAGVDISNRYEGRGGTTAIANTGFKTGAGVDIATLFRDINAITFPATDRTASTVRTSGTANAGYRLTSTGDVWWQTIGAPFADTGEDWVNPTSIAANYSCKATLVSGTNPTTGTMGTVLPLTSDRSWTNSQSSIGVKQTNMDIAIIRNSDSAVVWAVNITIRAEISP